MTSSINIEPVNCLNFIVRYLYSPDRWFSHRFFSCVSNNETQNPLLSLRATGPTMHRCWSRRIQESKLAETQEKKLVPIMGGTRRGGGPCGISFILWYTIGPVGCNNHNNNNKRKLEELSLFFLISRLMFKSLASHFCETWGKSLKPTDSVTSLPKWLQKYQFLQGLEEDEMRSCG